MTVSTIVTGAPRGRSASAPKAPPGAQSGGAPAYRVLVPLEYPTDPDIVARLVRGDQIPLGERGMVARGPGDLVRDIPACSIPWLIEQELIEPVTGAQPATAAQADEAGEA